MSLFYNFCSIFVVKRMGAEYMRGLVKKSKNEPVTPQRIKYFAQTTKRFYQSAKAGRRPAWDCNR